jgi:hypothetical protein
MCPRLLLFFCPASQRRREGRAWSGEVGRKHTSRCSPRCPLGLLSLHVLFRVSAAPIICGMGVFSFRQTAAAACWGGRYIPFLGALLKSKSKSKSHYDWRSDSQSVSLGVDPHLELMTRYLLLFESHGLVFVGRPLWREDGSVFCQSHCPQ